MVSAGEGEHSTLHTKRCEVIEREISRVVITGLHCLGNDLRIRLSGRTIIPLWYAVVRIIGTRI
jgi:hypothetical protein